VTEYPSAVSIVSDTPLPGTEPAKLTVPPAGAATDSPSPAPISIPRRSPDAYGCARSNENVSSTGPATGQVHACAAETGSPRSTTTASRNLRIESPLLSVLKTNPAR
jgi:hypothetical protein